MAALRDSSNILIREPAMATRLVVDYHRACQKRLQSCAHLKDRRASAVGNRTVGFRQARALSELFPTAKERWRQGDERHDGMHVLGTPGVASSAMAVHTA